MKNIRFIQQLYSAVHSFSDPLIILDDEWRFVYLNTAGLDHFGRSESELTGRVIWDEFPALRHSFIADELGRAARDRERVSFEAQSKLRESQWFEIHGLPVDSGLVVHFRNITAAKVAAEKLRKLQIITDAALSHLELQELLDELLLRITALLRAETGVILLRDGNSDTLRPAAAYGFDGALDSEFVVPFGKGFSGRIAAERQTAIVADVEEDRDVQDLIYPPVREKGIRSLLGAPLIGQDRLLGVIHLGSLRRDWFTAEDGQLLLLAAGRIALAVSQSRMYETEQVLREAAEDANRVKDRFLGNVSHELRAPLTVITGWIHVIRQNGWAAKEGEPAIEILEKNAHLLAQLIEDLIDLTRTTSGKLTLNASVVDLGPIVDAVIDAIRVTAEPKHIQIEQRVPAETPKIWGDPDRIHQILWNLMSNAIKFTDASGRISVSIDVRGAMVAVVVQDTGIGIEKEFLPYVFEPFRQVEQSGKRYGGLGLGLAIVRDLVRLHGGAVEVDSAGVNQGAKFTVLFPVLARKAAARS